MRAIIFLSALSFIVATVAPVPAIAGSTAPLSVEISAQKRAPSPTCDRERKACMSGSARTGNFGARYVPPEAVAMCQESYRRCIGRR